MAATTSVRHIEDRAAHDHGAAVLFYLLASGFTILVGLIFWYFPSHV